jgi:hypothetical protein
MRGRHRTLISAIVALAALAALGSSPGAAEAAAAHAAPIATAAATQNSATTAPGSPPPSCGEFWLAAYYVDGAYLGVTNSNLTFGTAGNASALCQEVVSGSNVVIYDLSYGNGDYCLAYSAATRHVYLHPSCTTAGAPSYEQWKFLNIPTVGIGSGESDVWMLESGYQINGVNYCMEEDGASSPPLGGCSAHNHQAVLTIITS